MECKLCRLDENSNGFITETDFWRIFLSWDQLYLGRCKVVLKRHCGALGEMKGKEWDDFTLLVKKLESALNKIFSPSVFNWTCLMNHGFRDENDNPSEGSGDPHIHWHFRPRYDRRVEFEGMMFEDKEFGFHYIDASVKLRKIPVEVRKKLIGKIRAEI